MIIDVHMHLGDILHKDGGKIISHTVEMPNRFNIQRFEEDILKFNSFPLSKIMFEILDDHYTRSVSDRIKAGTYENLKRYYNFLENTSSQLFGDSLVRSFCMPVAPYVTFEDLYLASSNESRLLSFNSIDPTYPLDLACHLLKETMPYCYGLKLHPIIQGIPFNSEYTYCALDIINGTGKPVLLHAGASRYYLGNEKHFQHCEYDDPLAAREMIRRYPDIPFIIGHAGIAEYKTWASLLHKYENVYFDITVQSVSSIKQLIKWYGEDKMLFATDWPCVNPETTLKIVKKALNEKQLKKLMYENALSLFGSECVNKFL